VQGEHENSLEMSQVKL